MLVNGLYHERRGGWDELFDYGGVRYHARLFPNHDGKGIQNAILLSLGRACEQNNDIMDDHADECRRLIWPLIQSDYASRPQSEKMNLSPSKTTVKIEGRTVDGMLQAFTQNGNLDYSAHSIPNKFPGIPILPHSLTEVIPSAITLEDVLYFKKERYHQCMSQIQSAVEYLHGHSLVWG